MASPKPSIPPRSAPRLRRITGALVPAGGQVTFRMRFTDSPAAGVTPAGGFRRMSSPTASARPTNSTPPSSRRTFPTTPERDAPGLRRHALVQAVLPLRGARLAARRSRLPAPSGQPPAGPQSRMAASLQRRRHLHAGQVGVSVVRRLGPGVPLHPLALVDSRFRQRAAHA